MDMQLRGRRMPMCECASERLCTFYLSEVESAAGLAQFRAELDEGGVALYCWMPYALLHEALDTYSSPYTTRTHSFENIETTIVTR